MKRVVRRLSSREASALGFCALLALVCLLICSKSSPLYPINGWTDANVYFTIGKGMARGRVLYRDLYDHKGPLLYALHALCALVCSDSFLAVFWMEVACATCFLYSIYRLLCAYDARRAALFALPVIAVLVYSSVAFEQGDSAEELCLPMLGWSLYALMKETRGKAGKGLRARSLVGNGVLCGMVLWVKFTILGFYAGWLLCLLIWRWRDGGFAAALRALGWFALGVGLATIPWVVYFGCNGALGAWLKTYLYDNIFLYSGTASSLKKLIKSFLTLLWGGVTDNLRWTLPTLLGMSVAMLPGVLATARERLALWSVAALTALGVYIGGRNYIYYALTLAAFVGAGFLPLCRWAEGLFNKRRLSTRATALCLSALVALAGGACYAFSPNVGELGMPRSETMQYKLAAYAKGDPDATLLNYGFTDAGLFTSMGITPTLKYFHCNNVPLQDMYEEQYRYLREGVTKYVVSCRPLSDEFDERYALIDTADAPEGYWYEKLYFYRLREE